jgi:hypothetical protein
MAVIIRTLALFIVFSSICMGTSTVHAGDAAGNYYVRGFGSQSCARYLKERKAGSAAYVAFRTWANGYVTSYNQFAADTYDAAANFNISAVAAMLANFCRTNQKSNFVSAVYAVTRELHKFRIEKRSPEVQVSAGKRKLRVFVETIRRVQEFLKQQGLYSGGIDGKFGKGTSAAISAYQKKRKLSDTGLPDGPTLIAIYREISAVGKGSRKSR